MLSGSLVLPQLFKYYITAPDRETAFLKANLFYPSVNLLRYSTYRVYQNSLTYEERSNQIVDIPSYTFSELALSTFDRRSYEDGIIGIIPVAAVIAYPTIRTCINGIDQNLSGGDLVVSVPLILIQSALFATGEEAYFRGFIYPSMSELSDSPLIGNMLQSLYFGFSHTQLSKDIGLRQFPHLTGTLFHYTSTVDEEREYQPDETPSSNFAGMSDLERFAAMTAMGFAMGVLASEEDGLLKSTMLHSLITSSAILSDLLIEGSTGRFMMEVNISF